MGFMDKPAGWCDKPLQKKAACGRKVDAPGGLEVDGL
jgi:hypothetical protein